VQDALRRDFKCNAVYYDITNAKFVDPLGGITDIKNKVLDTVKQAEQVFESDGLRLMRLARFSGELNLKPTEEVFFGAKKYAENIKDISVERIFDELKKILVADKKYSFSSRTGHYDGLKILDKTGVLDHIIPELTLGRNMAQRKDFHNYDVLEHSLRAVLYAPENVRLSALLHDVGKPYCMMRDGQFYNHNVEGARIAEEVLKRLKAPNERVREVVFNAKYHMLDLDLKMKESKVKRFIAQNYCRIFDLLALKQADYSACKDDLNISNGVVKWQKIIEKIKEQKVPTDLSMVEIDGKDLVEIGYKGKEIKETLKKLFLFAVDNPKENQREKLYEIAKKWLGKG
jgi:tRNA nucleotidyltransferase (CCA-adding enzyme)